MTNEFRRQNAFHVPCGGNSLPSSATVDGFYPMRDWQRRSFDTLREAPLMILNAPMGSGKSWLMCALTAHKMKGNGSLRSIISVPQTIIAPGFVEAKIQMPDGELLHWCVEHNLCKKESSKGTVKYIENWLSQQYHCLNERVLVCTHATLVKTYKKLKEEGRLDLLTDLLLWIDEAHHVKNASMEDFEGEVISNGIGDLVKHLLNRTDGHTQLGLTTASFFRGDRCSLLTKAMEARFERASLACDEYLRSMEYLKSFSFDFLLHGHEYTNAIRVVAGQRKGKDIVYVPHPNSKHSTGDKYQEVKNIFAEYQKLYGGDLIETRDGLNLLQNAKGDFKMLDLVDEDRRIEKKEFLNGEHLKKQRDALDLIIALGMFKEGANWIWADRCIIVGVRDSLVDVVQMMGRLFRDAKDKHHVEVIQLLPFSLDQQSDGFRDNLNSYLKAIFASLILEDVLNPVKISTPFSANEEKGHEKEKIGNKNTTAMCDLIPDESTRLSVIDDVTKRLVSISDTNKKVENSVQALYEEYQRVLPEILEDYGITAHVDEIGEKIWGMLTRRSLKMQGIAVEEIDFDILKSTHPLEGLLRYTTDACGIETFAQLRAAIRSCDEEKNVRWESNFALLAKHAEKSGSCRVNKDYEVTVDGKVVKIGSWFSDQKKNFTSLPLSKQERLQKLPGFVAKKFSRNESLAIDEWIDLFISVSEKLGTPLIPNSYVEDGYNLGAWIQHIRKAEEWENLSPDQKQRLSGHNFKLFPKEERREACVLAMSQFVLREGKAVPKYGHKEEIVHKGAKYSIRLDNLRNQIKNAPEKIEPGFLEAMMKISKFSEELHDDKEDAGEYLIRGLAYYKKFKNRTGRTIIPKGHIEDAFDLHGWNQKVRGRRELEDSFEKELLAIDPLFFSDHILRTFIQDIQPRIEAFIQEKGHPLIPQGYRCSDGYPLGEKVCDLRERRSNLSKPIKDHLDSLSLKGRWAWNHFEYVFLQRMQELLSFIENRGYHPQELPEKVQELIKKVKNGPSKYPSSERLKVRIEELAPGIFD